MNRMKGNPPVTMEDIQVGAYIVSPKVLGKGAWSVVHCATDTRTRAEVVAKVISKAKLKEKGTVVSGEELREVAIMRRLPSHRNIVRLLDVVETDKHFYLFLEKLANGDLCDFILNSPNGRLSETQCRKYLRQIISGLLTLHGAGVAHRDVKPENMLLDSLDVIKITDFGLAKRHARSRFSVTQPEELSKELVGTLRYAAPEMFLSHFRGTMYDAFTSDVWSVGVCLYIMFTGSFPYSAGPSADEKQTWDVLQNSDLVIPTDISREGIDLLKKLLAKDPKQRMRLQEIDTHAWLRNHVSPPLRSDASHMNGNHSEAAARAQSDVAHLQDLVQNLQGELSRYKDMVKTLSDELSRERSTREKLEKMLKDSSGGATVADGAATPNRNITPVKSRTPAATPGLSSGTGRTISPQRVVGPSSSVASSTPSRSSPKRVAPRVAPSPTRKTNSPTAVRNNSPIRVVPSSTAKSNPPPNTQALRRSSPVVRFGTPVGNSSPNAKNGPSTPTRAPNSPVAMVATPPDGSDLRVGQMVKYKGTSATVRFLGTTGFADGIWIGLELAEATGLNDGSCFIDKRRYFTCPQSHGVFVRRSQVTV